MILKVNIDGYIDKYGGFSLTTLKNIVEANPEATELELYINSEGGDVIEGFAIHDYLNALGKEVTVVIEGLCASIATVIALAAKKEKRKMYSNAKIMIHNPYWTPSAPIGMESNELSSLASELAQVENQLADFYTSKLGLDITAVKEMMKAETWMTASKALEMGFVNSVINAASASARKQLPIKAQIKINNMNKEFTEEQKSWLEQKLTQIENSFKNLFKGNVKNELVVKLNDGKEVYVETEDGDLMGKQVYLMENGNVTETPAPDGEHTTEDGRVLVVAGGIVTEVKEAADVEAMKKENDEMKKANAELTEQIQNNAKELENLKAQFEAKVKEFTAFRASIVNGTIEQEQDFPKGNQKQAEKSLVEKAIEFRNKQKQQ